MPNTDVATISHTGWIITPDISGLESEFVNSLVKVTANLTDSVRLIRSYCIAINTSK